MAGRISGKWRFCGCLDAVSIAVLNRVSCNIQIESHPVRQISNMQILTQQLSAGSSLAVSIGSSVRKDNARLVMTVGSGRACVLNVDGSFVGIWIPLRGRLQLSTSECELALLPGDLRITEPEGSIQATGRGNALWVSLLGNHAAWQQALKCIVDVPAPEPLLFPARYDASRELRRRTIALARAADGGNTKAAATTLFNDVFELQSAFADAIARCPGRTLTQRRQKFARLQRVRNYIAANCHLELDTRELARRANYSPWQFIRTFSAVYQETPHTYLVSQRLNRAHNLLRTSELAVAEIARACGFGNRCAFSRVFHRRFSTTAHALRNGIQGTSRNAERRAA